MNIPFNKPYLTGSEFNHLQKAVATGKISGNGEFTKKCHNFFESNLGFKKCLLTTSCTDALEMAAILLDIKKGDEVIMPSYTFVSTANAFILRGAKIVFVDSLPNRPGMDETFIENLITKKTKAIIPVHYAGVACNMDVIMALATQYNLFVVEDAAQAISSYYMGADGVKKPLGSIGHLATFSFHETKNISAGEGGLLVINDSQFAARAEIIWEKGTNRSAFFRGEVNKYGWVDIGSSFLPSELTAAFLFAQLESLTNIQKKRISIWNEYHIIFHKTGLDKIFGLPNIPNFATNNGHMFYVLCPSNDFRQRLIVFLKEKGILSVFHYLSLHKSEFYKNKYEGSDLPNTDRYSDTLLRLPFYYELELVEVAFIVEYIAEFCEKEV
ncbi:MAG: dTDP-4-amino-4,6-dideoxygalactose transaminase [Cyclobacteriaceae bacterium]|nr:dTDP-4-amino-4,6-dideoxygalactose transaminase [Cyclobacteriaceae bacterium]